MYPWRLFRRAVQAAGEVVVVKASCEIQAVLNRSINHSEDLISVSLT